MPVLRININGRYYDITCEKNKEKYGLELSKYFNEKVKNLKPLVVRFDHGFMRPVIDENNIRTFRKLGVDVITFASSSTVDNLVDILNIY